MFENILYATDFSESPLMLPCVGIIGNTKKIHLLHVASEEARIDPQLLESRMLEAKSFLEETLKAQGKEGIGVDVHLLPGVPARDICGVAKHVDASLIVITYHKPEGLAGGVTMELIKSCDRNLLAFTKLSSDAVDRSREAMNDYCANLFSRVICPAAGDTSTRIKRLAMLKKEVRLGTVVFSGFSDDAREHLEDLVRETKASGIDAEYIIKKGLPGKSIIGTAEDAGASIILVDAVAELGLALTVTGASDFPSLVLKSP